MQITVFDCERDEQDLFHSYAKSYGIDINIVDKPVSTANARLASGSKSISISHKNKLCEPALIELKSNGVEFVTTRSIGVNHIDLPAADRLGITVDNIMYSPDSIADHTMMLILMALRNAKDVLGRVDNKDFSLAYNRSRDLREMTVGVIGYGRIGQRVATRLRAFGCRILIYEIAEITEPAETVCSCFDELIAQCDVLTFHLPLTLQTRHILNRENIRKVKNGAYIINTGRGDLIETSALLDALKKSEISGAALDVLEGEEDIFYYDYQNRKIENEIFASLHEMQNVIITPHSAYYTQQALLDTVENTIIKCLKFERSMN